MRKSKKYVVGYDGDGECIYGEDDIYGNSSLIFPMTLTEAKKMLKELDPSENRAIYKLIKVKDE